MAEPYSFEVTERDDGAVFYNFITINQVGYTVMFQSTSVTNVDACFESPNICANGYIIAFMREGFKFTDVNVFCTIDSIIDDFIEKFGTKESAFFYTCDNSDGKHFARQRMFENYICRINSEKYTGTNIIIEDKEDNTTHCIGCFFLNESSVGEEILKEFDGFSLSLMEKN